MALTKVTYTDLVTIIGAQNLNDIQDAIIALEEWQSEAGADIPQILANIAPSFSNSTNNRSNKQTTTTNNHRQRQTTKQL